MNEKSHPRKQPLLPRRRRTTAPSTDELAWTVRVLRSLPGWTQSELAIRSGVTESSICRYERGQQTPSPQTLERLCEAVGVPQAAVEEILCPALREMLAARSAARPAEGAFGDAEAWTEDLLTAIAGILRPQLGLVVREVLAAMKPWGRGQPPSAADREGAAELWQVLRDSSKEDRILLLEETREYRGWPVCELACAEALNVAPDSADQAVEYAELAVEIARLAPVEELFRQRLQGYAEGHRGNAWRVHGKLREADAIFARARVLWQAGAPGDPGLLDEALVLGLEGSLRIDQHRPAEALKLLEQALAADRGGLTKHLLINRGRALEQLGDYDGAITALRQAPPLIDGQQEPRLLWVVRFNLCKNLCHLRRFGEAAEPLKDARALAEGLSQELDLLRTLWLEGWVSAGLGRKKEAVPTLEQVSQEFIRLQIPSDAALASLELAVLYLEEGRTAEVRALAEALVKIFAAQEVHQGALAALRLFYEAAKKETATVELAQRLVEYLYRAQHDPELRFED